MMRIPSDRNAVVCGDNLEWLKNLDDGSVDVCYIDPPFFSNRNYEVIWGNGYELRCFGDRFSGGISHYIEWMRPRIELIHSKLKKTGSLFLHCDRHASHRLRVLLDDTFGEQYFRGELIWKRIFTVKNNSGQGTRGFEPNTDSILYFTKSEKYTFNPVYAQYSDAYLKVYKHVEPESGRRYRLISMIGPGGAAKGNPYYEVMGISRFWRYSKKKMQELIGSGMVVQTKPGTVPQRKLYLDGGKGVPAQALWDDLTFGKNENLGYPTQKPESLVSRILTCSSQPGDVVLDCFGGGGVTAKVAADLGRRFIVGDVSPVAVRLTTERLRRECPTIPFDLRNLPNTTEEYRKINGHAFATMVCDLMGWRVNERKSGDAGVDGWDGLGFPIQVKNHGQATGRPDIQRFYGALAAQKKKRGVFVAWEFSKQAVEYIAEVKREHQIEIVTMRCGEVFKSLLIDKSKRLELDALYEKRVPAAWSNDSPNVNDHDAVLKTARRLKKEVAGKLKEKVEKSAG